MTPLFSLWVAFLLIYIGGTGSQVRLSQISTHLAGASFCDNISKWDDDILPTLLHHDKGHKTP